MAKRLLIIDDEEAICWSLARAFERADFVVDVAASAEAGFDLARKHAPDAVLLDVRLPGLDGLSALERMRQITGDVPIVIMTAHGNLSTAVRAVEGGAFDYLPKPFDLSQAIDIVQRALRRPDRDSGVSAEPLSTEEIIGTSPVMQRVFKQIALAAPRDVGVLITGESGTGKELVARALHRHSGRRDKPFIPVHVAALNPNLVESELFGHVKGAFTGAAQTRPGLLALADGGTVFLDEVADIPLPVQAKLLRVLEHNEVLPVGGTQPQQLDLRVISATHRDLASEVAAGRFRHDLYFRLNGFPIWLPPLRDRGDDRLLLAEHFVRRVEPSAWPLPDETCRYLNSRLWYGNVREFRAALEHALIVAHGGPVMPEHFPPPSVSRPGAAWDDQLAELIRQWIEEMAAKGEPSNLYQLLLDRVEPLLLKEVLARVQGNRVAASRWLGLARATVRKLISRHLPGTGEALENDAAHDA